MKEEKSTTNWTKIYTAVFITGIVFILSFWIFTSLFNLP
tara:strand:+ start:2555 stop:2671 length:117 start_codon:yes stop_codon:yes gene_type:complete